MRLLWNCLLSTPNVCDRRQATVGMKTLEYPLNVTVCRREEVCELCLWSEGTNFPDFLLVVGMPTILILSVTDASFFKELFNISLHYDFSNGVLLSSELQGVDTLHVVATRIGLEDGGMSVTTFVFIVFLVGVPFLFILDAEAQLRFRSHVFYLIYSYSALPSAAALRMQEIEIVYAETSRYKFMRSQFMLISCITKLLQLCAQSE